MPGSLLSPPQHQQRVSRNESTRSDHSDCSNTSQSSAAGKKVSFNKAVRVKKYTRPKKSLSNGDLTTINGGTTHSNGVSSGSPEKRFWFRVYKNKHRHPPDPKELRPNGGGVIYYDNDPTGHIPRHVNDDVISYHPNPSTLNYPALTSENSTQTPPGPSSWRHNDFTPLHPSQMPTEPPHVKRNHVKKIVNRFNEEAVLQKQRSSDGEVSPPGSPVLSPRYHSTPMKSQRIPTPPPEPPLLHYGTKHHRSEITTPSKSKKNPIVNGVKVIFGMTPLMKKKNKPVPDSKVHDRHDLYRVHSTDSSVDPRRFNGRETANGDHRAQVTVSDGSDTEVKAPHRQYKTNGNHGALVNRTSGGLFRHDENNEHENFDDYYFDENNENTFQRRGKVHVETYDSGNQLVFDTTDVNTASKRLDNGELFCTVGEKHQMWQNNKRIVVVEEPSPKIIRRKAKSHSDLLNSEDEYKSRDTIDKGVSTEQLVPYKRDEINGTRKAKDSGWLRLWRSTTKDKGVQCSKVPTSMYDEDIYAAGKYKVIKPRNGVATAYSDVPNLDKHYTKNHAEYVREDDHTSAISSSYQNGDIYSQVDKSKKRRDAKKKAMDHSEDTYGSSNGLFKSRSEPLYIGPPPKEIREIREHYDDYYLDDDEDHTVKTSKRSFGFRLNPGSEKNTLTKTRRQPPVYREENWYDVDDDVEAVEKLKGRGLNHHDMSEIREEIANEEYASDFSSAGDHKRNDVGAGSLMREFDYKKREISYENVPRSAGDSNGDNGTGANSGLWFREADEDYRKEMAQSEVSYPAGSHVGSDRFYTVSRTDRASKHNSKPPPSPRAYTLDRRHLKDKKKTTSNSSGVKILVNGKEVHDGGSKISKKSKGYLRKSRVSEDPSSVQSDPLYVRGGLAAAYQARQRAAIRRSNSSVAGISDYRTSPAARRRHRGTSEASSETESAHARRPLVMYIPGVSHYEKSPEENDRSSGVNVARSQSMMTSTRPSKISSKSSKSSRSGSRTELYRKPQIYEEEDEIMPLASDSNRKKPPKVPYDKKNDIKRRHSMPKDTKFSWLKWRLRIKPSREP